MLAVARHVATASGHVRGDSHPTRLMLRYLPGGALILDGGAMVAVGLIAVIVRQWPIWSGRSLDTNQSFWIATPLILGSWIAVIALLGGYRERLFGAGVDEYKIVVNASLLTGGLTGVACYLLKFDLSRGFFVLAFSLGVVCLVGERALLRRAVHRARRLGVLCRNVVIAGNPTHVDEIAGVLRRESWLGYHVLGAIVPSGFDAVETVRGIPVLGATDDVLGVVASSGADVIFVANGAMDCAERMRELVWDLEGKNVQVVVAPSFADISRERVRFRPVGGLPLVHIDPPRSLLATRRLKRTFDIVLASVILLAVAPVFLFTAVTIYCHDRGPVFFRQMRVGRGGSEFNCLKFRTMVIDAEALLSRLQSEQGFTTGLFKMADDPRVTTPGRWLRRFSLDELPQLINVFQGDMSLVGPRPPLPSEVAAYDRFTQRRLHVRPGMTGLWQVSGRSDLSFTEAVRLDLYYVDNWSMLQDMTILARTFRAVVASRGAY